MIRPQMLSNHVFRKDFACKCGCGKIGKYAANLKEVIKRIEKMYDLQGGLLPIIITSGYRCPKHNEEVGGVPNSYHCQDMAVDLYIPGWGPEKIANLAERAGFRGIGVYWGQGFVHCDIRKDKYRWYER